MLELEKEIHRRSRLKRILKEYNIKLSEKEMEQVVKGTFDYHKFEEKYPLPAEKDIER